MLAVLLLVGTASAASPEAAFFGTPVSGTVPLTVAFTDTSAGEPTGWAWFFGDERYGEAWTEQTANAGWAARSGHSSVVLPDGSIVLMGGSDKTTTYRNDTWRSTDGGATWTLVNASAGWTGRAMSTSVATPDSSIVLMGGFDDTYDFIRNDVWRSTDGGATWTLVNPHAAWPERFFATGIATPDGSILLAGGFGWSGTGPLNDTWRSDDRGATWTLVNASSGWAGRYGHAAVATPDGSVVLMGGGSRSSSTDLLNDTWRSTDGGATWTLANASSGWTARQGHTAVAMPDGSIVVAAGWDGNGRNDMWRSTDRGATWTLVNPDAGWTARQAHSSVAMPDGSILLMGGSSSGSLLNDTWRLQPAGSTEQSPTHTYTAPGNYTITLSVDGGLSIATKPGYIGVTPVLFGDTTEDGEVNQADTLLVLQEIVGFREKPAAGTDRFRKTDVNANGVIEVGDALFIAQYNVGLRSPWFELL
ncbi:kelch repeat-containing protein [Methanoculleus sp.]|uniref:kelch repeat-containing protein n=1 Tax=Methanoculleus sp. TaxID=90427 RepID=UPI00320DF06C